MDASESIKKHYKAARSVTKKSKSFADKVREGLNASSADAAKVPVAAARPSAKLEASAAAPVAPKASSGPTIRRDWEEAERQRAATSARLREIQEEDSRRQTECWEEWKRKNPGHDRIPISVLIECGTCLNCN